MKSPKTYITALLLGALAATTVACSSHPRGAVSSSVSDGTSVFQDNHENSGSASTSARPVATTTKTASTEKPAPPKLITYKSRDYGVSFVYPWQYSFHGARSIANSDASLKPKSDGHDGQVTLARVDVPKGFYSDSDFESGYFTLSLDQDLSDEECQASLGAVKNGKTETETINGQEFRWVESESGGRGQATKLRQYATFTNGTCYQVEMGVNTRNDDGLAREVNPDQVMRRLDAILKTVTIVPDETPVAAEAGNTTGVPTPDPQK